MPRKKNPKDGVYLTAWTAQMYCKKPSKAALQHMIDEWRDQGPELFTNDASMDSNAK
jgi:kynureninase